MTSLFANGFVLQPATQRTAQLPFGGIVQEGGAAPPSPPDTSSLRIITNRRAHAQPHGVFELDRSHPLARDLVLATVPNVGTHVLRDCVSERVFGLDPLATPGQFTRATSRAGVGVRATAVDANGFRTPLTNTQVKSVVVVGAQVTANSRGMFLGTYPTSYFGLTDAGLPTMRAYSNSLTVDGATAVPLGQVAAFGYRFKALDYSIFLNGRKDAASAVNYGDSAEAGDGVNLLGVAYDGYAHSAMSLYLALVWNRHLLDRELAEITARPWQLFLIPRPRLISISGSPASHNFWRLYPNAIISKSKLAGLHTDIDENPATPDGSWLTFDAGQ